MFRKLFALILALCLCFAVVGCGDNEVIVSTDESTVETSSEPEIKDGEYVNTLTGIGGLTKAEAEKRPVAIMINNISIAQPVQTGLNEADIVYETEVEGSITRLLGVFKDTTAIEKIGTVRSARYVYIDLAMGHDAIYAYHGFDHYHAAPHLNDVDNIVVASSGSGTRISNGLATEHTLYAYGQGLWDAIEKKGFRTTVSADKTWQNFAKEDAPVTLGSTANKVKVPFSNASTSTFEYDAEQGKYVRYANGTKRVDYFTDEVICFKNVFVLNTSINTYANCSDGYKHKEVKLNSGDGYYFVNGTYTKIKWSKGASSNSFTFTNEDGSALTVNPGNSWVCIAGMQSQPVIE